MTIEDEEKQLIEEIEFFNKAVMWWSSEFERADKELKRLQRKHFIGVTSEQVDLLVEKLKYLAGKAKVEQKTAENIDIKIYKLNLKKELRLIQGDFPTSKKKKN